MESPGCADEPRSKGNRKVRNRHLSAVLAKLSVHGEPSTCADLRFIPHLRVRRPNLSVPPATTDEGFCGGFSISLLATVSFFRRYGAFVAAPRSNLTYVDIYSNLNFYNRIYLRCVERSHTIETCVKTPSRPCGQRFYSRISDARIC